MLFGTTGNIWNASIFLETGSTQTLAGDNHFPISNYVSFFAQAFLRMTFDESLRSKMILQIV